MNASPARPIPSSSGGEKESLRGRRAGLEKLEEGERGSIEIVLDPPALIAGTVDRKAFPDASRVVLHAALLGVVDYMSVTLTSGQEKFELADLPAGTYTVTLMGPLRPALRGPGMTSQRIDSVQVRLGPGEIKEVEFNPQKEKKEARLKQE